MSRPDRVQPWHEPGVWHTWSLGSRQAYLLVYRDVVPGRVSRPDLPFRSQGRGGRRMELSFRAGGHVVRTVPLGPGPTWARMARAGMLARDWCAEGVTPTLDGVRGASGEGGPPRPVGRYVVSLMLRAKVRHTVSPR